MTIIIIKNGDTPKEERVDTKGLSQEAVLQALFAYAKQSNMNDMLSNEQIRFAQNKEWQVGRIGNKSLHVDLKNGNYFNAAYYNQVNGENVAQDAIAALRKLKK